MCVFIKRNMSSRDTPLRGHPLLWGSFLQAVSYLPYVNKLVIKETCPLKTDRTVYTWSMYINIQTLNSQYCQGM